MSRRVPLHDTRSPMDPPSDVPPVRLSTVVGLLFIAAGVALAVYAVLSANGSIR